jgi:hypothetical protein
VIAMTVNDKTPDLPYCACGRLAERDLATCGHYDCELHERGPGALELARDNGGWRHFLVGEPVRCGTGLELASVRDDADDVGRALADDGTHTNAGSQARLRWIPVRYESHLATSTSEPPALLFADVGGHDAVIRGHAGMRLRWPHRRGW